MGPNSASEAAHEAYPGNPRKVCKDVLVHAKIIIPGLARKRISQSVDLDRSNVAKRSKVIEEAVRENLSSHKQIAQALI